MNRMITYIFFIMFNCSTNGPTELIAQLPDVLEEVSGIEYDANRDLFWMINDSGNPPVVYLVSKKGEIQNEIKVDAKNKDWEDIALDRHGNLYVGDFGNNNNTRKNLRIYKIKASDLDKKKVKIVKTEFYYPEQKNFPPKKKRLYYDTEAFFTFNNHFYILTKSRVKGEYGRTFLYKVPIKEGRFKAEKISEFITCKSTFDCSITGADISVDGKKIALITHHTAWVFSNYTGDDFFNGDVEKYPLGFVSQKESITFKGLDSIYIADEKNKYNGQNLYLLKLDN